MICPRFEAFIFLDFFLSFLIHCTSPNDLGTEGNETVLLPISKIDDFEVSKHIPLYCETLGICDHVDSYPEPTVNDILKKLKINGIKFYTEDCTIDDDDNFQRSRPLCESEIKCFSPKAVKGETGKWYLVLNTKESPVQNFTGQKCENNLGRCSRAVIDPKSTCEQIYFERPMVVLNTRMDAVILKYLPVPCCCKCHIREEWVQEETQDD